MDGRFGYLLICAFLLSATTLAVGDRCSSPKELIPEELKLSGCTISPDGMTKIMRSEEFRKPFLKASWYVFLKAAIMCDEPLQQVFGVVCRSCVSGNGKPHHAEDNLNNYLRNVLDIKEHENIKNRMKGKSCDLWLVINRQPCPTCTSEHLVRVKDWITGISDKVKLRIAWASFGPPFDYKKPIEKCEGKANIVERVKEAHGLYIKLKEVGFKVYRCNFTDIWFDVQGIEDSVKHERQQQTKCETLSMEKRYPEVQIPFKYDCLDEQTGQSVISSNWS